MTDYIYGKVFVDNEFKERYIEIVNGKINKISTERGNGTVRTIEGYILPGGIDIHVHFRDPGEEHKEDFFSGSKSAIYGGTTTVADMPNNKKPINSTNVFLEKLKTIQGRSFTDFALYQLPISEDIPSSIGQKVFMGKSTGGLISDLNSVVDNNKVKVFHAEEQACLDKFKIDDKNLRNHDVSRPLECEFAAIEKIAYKNFRNILIAHVTSFQAASLAKMLGFNVEVTPHHVLLNRDMNLGSLGKVNPPLRKKRVQEELLNSLKSGKIDIISSDHAPHTLQEKEIFDDAPSGMPGVETRLPLMLMLAKRGIIEIWRAVKMLSENPARVLKINKGLIAPGYDADFIITDMNERKISADMLHYKCGWTAYEGFNGVFPLEVIQRGEEILVDGEIVEQPRGVFISGEETRE